MPKDWEHSYDETPTEIRIQLRPSSTSAIEMGRSEIRRGQTVRNLGALSRHLQLIDGIYSVSPRGNHLFVTIKKGSKAWGIRSILDDVFAQIDSFLDEGEMLTREVNTQLNTFSEER